jgi:hypothetical protein
MEVVSLCPCRVGSLVWQRAGTFFQTIVFKATYSLAPGVSSLARSQEYINEDDNHWNDDPARSVYSPSDFAPFKRRADVVLVGHAFAPHKEPVRTLVCRLVVGGVDKSIEVYGERAFSADGLLREGPRFLKMPLRYERAAGGTDTWNPVGVVLGKRSGANGTTPLPNLQPPGQLVSDPGDYVAPIGFGPIAPSWALRRDKLGRNNDFAIARLETTPMPDDIDADYFNVAPPDQVTDPLRPNERIVLEHLHPDHPRLVTSLPNLEPRAFVERRGRPPQEVALGADTLWIDTDRAVCTVTWRGQIALDRPNEPGRVLFALAEAGQSMTFAEIERMISGETTGEQTNVPETADDPHVLKERSGTLVQKPKRDKRSNATLPFIGAEDLPADGNEVTNTGLLQLAQQPVTQPSHQPLPPKEAPYTRRRTDTDPPPAVADAAPVWLQRPGGVAPPPLPSSMGNTGAFKPVQQPLPTPMPPQVPLQPAPIPPPPMAPNDGLWGTPRTRESQPAVAPPAFVVPSNNNIDASSGVVAASNAAAAAWSATTPPQETPAVTEVPKARARPPREMIDLVFYDPESMAKIREHAPFAKLLAELAPKPKDVGFEDEVPPEPPPELRDKRDVIGLLARGVLIDPTALDAALDEAVADDGSFTPPLVLIAGEVQLPFDELETLKATVTAVTPLASGDKKLKETLDTVTELLKTPWLQSSSGVAEGLTQRVKEAFAQANRMVPASYLETHTDRILLEQRCYQKRTVFGDPWIRATTTLTPGNAAAQNTVLPTYLPAAIEKKLPMFQRFRARILAELSMQQDQYESSPVCLKVLALGRVAPIRAR